jgi:hypothetical protein
MGAANVTIGKRFACSNRRVAARRTGCGGRLRAVRGQPPRMSDGARETARGLAYICHEARESGV